MQFKQVSKFILSKLQAELPAHLSYHNIAHTLDVYQAAETIAEAEAISAYEQKLLLTAALFHDSGFIKLREGHEKVSCNIAQEYLHAYNYSQPEIETICSLIMATRIPQSPKSNLAKILCDADLDYLGRDDFFILSSRLYTELCYEGLIKDEDAWNREQASFMAKHTYHTATSIKNRQPVKEKYISLVKSKL